MKFETPATTNPIDQLKVIGKPTDRIDGPLKTTGRARYAYERHDVVSNPAYGYVVGSAIAKVLRATGGTVINTAYIERLNATFRSALAPLETCEATPP